MDLVSLRNLVSQVKSNLFKNSNFYSIGMLKTQFRGTGLKFKEHQVYTHGDDVRFIDWKILAKTSDPYVKTFEEERNVEITVLLDAGATMLNGYDKVSKLKAAVEVCCLLYLIAAETNDYIHVVILTDKITNLRKLNGELGITSLLSELNKLKLINDNGEFVTEYNFSEKTFDIRQNLIRHLRKKREVVVLSDFNNKLSEKELESFYSYSNLHCFKLSSPLDRSENIGLLMNFRKSKFGLPNLGFVKTKKQNKLKKSHRKIVNLKVEDRYLEQFIKSMSR